MRRNDNNLEETNQNSKPQKLITTNTNTQQTLKQNKNNK